MYSTNEIESFLNDFSVSDWAKEVLQSALNRDLLDAEMDLEAIFHLIKQRNDTILFVNKMAV